jgi:hypothetical protein
MVCRFLSINGMLFEGEKYHSGTLGTCCYTLTTAHGVFLDRQYFYNMKIAMWDEHMAHV